MHKGEALEPPAEDEIMKLLSGRIMTHVFQILVLTTVCFLDIMASKDKQKGKDTLKIQIILLHRMRGGKVQQANQCQV